VKKVLVYILLSLHVFFTGNIWVFVNQYISHVHALTNTWDFSTPGDYVLSTTTWSEINSWVGRLKKTFFHIGEESNANLNGATDIVVDGNYAYVTSNAWDNIASVDISNPSAPVVADTLVDDGTSVFLNWPNEIIKNGDYLYIASQQSDAVQIVDASDPTNLIAAAVVRNIPASNELNGARGLAMSGDYLYVSAQTDRAIVTIDISTPTAPVVVDTDVLDTELRGTRSLKIVWDYIFATAYNRDRVTSLDISDPADPVLSDDVFDTALDRAWFIEADLNYAYVTTHTNNSLQILDISDPTAMSLVNSIPDGGSFLFNNVRDLTLNGDILFVTANNDDAITAIDVSNPLAPVFLDSIVNGAWPQQLNGARGLQSIWNRLYVASGVGDGIEILDFEFDTTSPTITPNTAFNFWVEDLSSFTETLWADNAGTVTYQISRNNGTDWYYYDGSAWTLTTAWVSESSSAAIINTNIDDFNSIGSWNEFLWRAYLTSDGNQKVEIDEIEVESTPSIPNLSITKTDNDADNIVNTSDVVRYTITLTNTGANASGISITDTIDTDFGAPYNFMYTSCGSPNDSFIDPTLTFSSVSVDAWESCVITYDVQVDSWAIGWATITNSADPSVAIEWWNDPAAATADTITVRECSVNDVNIVFETDNFAEDTYWSLTPNGNACGVWEIANGGNTNLTCASGWAQSANAADGYADSSNITEWPFTLTVGTQYDLHVIDDWWDGITVGWNAADPDIRIQQNWADSNTFALGDPSTNEILTFTVQEPTGCADTTDPSLTIDQAPSQSDPTWVNSATFRVVFDEPIDIATFVAGDITLAGTSWTVTSGPTEVAPNNGTSFEFSVTGMTDGDTVTATMLAWIIADPSGNTNNASTSTDNQITYSASDVIPPTITSISIASGSLLPGGNHTLSIEYNDADSGIDTASAIIQLAKWDGVSAYGPNIAGTGMTLDAITSTGASYSTNNLDFGKYLYAFQISDNDGNASTSTGAVFYIDTPEFTISTPEIDLGTLSVWTEAFSPTVTVTVRTVGAWFDVSFERSSTFTEGTEVIPSFDGTIWYGFQQTPYAGIISQINTNQNIATQATSINTNGDKNTYTYDIQIWALIDMQQSAWEYKGTLDFDINLTY